MKLDSESLGDDFDGVLVWGHVDNRPFLRCLYGYGLCCWRLDRFEEAERIFDRMLWLNPSDNQGARFLIDALRARRGRATDINDDVRPQNRGPTAILTAPGCSST